ncbi:DinB family protein [Fulvivirga sp. 29W222]|uniref:DinB family protein n=1 Tax=Fulvivirga marina TaxID=2494733 RepID=A0A937G036_9BACT|nr:DinB family protein [Fulvivirga marina]MBL6447525.1 DinB family protein [Fulvivirga marina]
MDKHLHSYFERLESSKNKLLSLVEGASHEKLNAKPNDQKWSALQVLYHMKEAEKLPLAYMKKKTLDPDALYPSTMKQKFRSYLLRIFLFLPVKFEAPRVVKEGMPEEITLEELKTDWDNVREDMHEFLDNLAPALHNKKIFKHPRIGMINIRQTMEFFQSHFDHHVPQVKSLIKNKP